MFTKFKREEGGTPDIIGSIRAALAFQLKEAVGEEFIESLETKFCERATNMLLGIQKKCGIL